VPRSSASAPSLTRAEVPPRASLARLRTVARGCHACPLYLTGTQTVFGEGPVGARVMLVGEQPGDAEDLAGHPFVGPAGRVLDAALASAGLARDSVYLTNAVKHFFWEPRGKRRIHKRPHEQMIAACAPWLDAEIDRVAPRVVVCLGAVAAKAIVGRAVRIGDFAGRVIATPRCERTIVTIHPSAALRAPTSEARAALRERLVADLRVAVARGAS
jgi:DNA polymerase